MAGALGAVAGLPVAGLPVAGLALLPQPPLAAGAVAVPGEVVGGAPGLFKCRVAHAGRSLSPVVGEAVAGLARPLPAFPQPLMFV